MSNISDQDLLTALEGIVTRFNDRLAMQLQSQPNLGLMECKNQTERNYFWVEELGYEPNNLFQSYLARDWLNGIKLLPKGNFLLHFVICRDYFWFQEHIRAQLWIETTTRKELRRYLAECLLYIRQARKTSDAHEQKFLNAFVTFIKLRGAVDQFYPANAQVQTEFPLPEVVKVVNVNNPNSNETIRTEDFIEMLKKVSNEKKV